MMKSLALNGALVCGLAAMGVAQSPLFDMRGTTSDTMLFYSTFVSDITGDGYPEIVEYGVRGDNVLYTVKPSLRLRSGRDGSVLRERVETRQTASYELITIGDMNGDGHLDIAITIFDTSSQAIPGLVEVRCGRTLDLIWSVSGRRWEDFFGFRIAWGEDLDGDGLPDLAVSASRFPPHGAIYAFDHYGQPLWQHIFPDTFPGPALSIGMIPDIDGDGCAEVLVGGQEPQFRGAVHIYSGRDGTRLMTCPGEFQFDNLGSGRVEHAGDLDGDGVPDFVASAQNGHGSVLGVVRAFSGATGQAIWTRRMPRSGYFGENMVANVDVDQDGVPDVLVSSANIYRAPSDGGVLYALCGRDGSILWELGPPVYDPATHVGYFSHFAYSGRTGVAKDPETDFPLLSVPENMFNTPPQQFLFARGRITVFRLLPVGMDQTGRGCQGRLAEPPGIGVRVLGGGGARLHLTRGEPGGTAVLLVGLSASAIGQLSLPLPLGSLGMPGCFLRTSMELAIPVQVGTMGVDRGYSHMDVPPLSGVHLHAQWWVPGAGTTAPGGVSAMISFSPR